MFHLFYKLQSLLMLGELQFSFLFLKNKSFSFIEDIKEETLMMMAKIGIFIHSAVNIRALVLVKNRNVSYLCQNYFYKIYLGELPFLTKGPFAMFFGGPLLEDSLPNSKPGKSIWLFFLASIIFNLTILGKIFFKC